MNVENAFTPTPSIPHRAPGAHFGPWPASSEIRASIRDSNANGFNTTLASTWAAAEIAGMEIHETERIAA